MTPRSSRGKCVALYSVAIGLGTLIVYIVNLVIASSSPESWLDDIGWRYMFASELVPALLFFIFLFFVPETPRHLVMKNNSNKAEYVLKQIFSNSKDIGRASCRDRVKISVVVALLEARRLSL